MSTAAGALIIIKADDTETREQLAEEPGLERLQSIVGGFIEAVPNWHEFEGHPAHIYCNEDGRANRLPLNVTASKLWRAVYPANAQLWYEPQIFGDLAIWVPL